MTRKSLDKLGSLQKSVMEAVWEQGEASVQQVLARLERTKPLAYTTVLSAMQKLEKAGWLRHREVGRSYVYRATRSRLEEGKNSLRRFLDSVFGGDPLPLFQHLLENQDLDAADLTAIRRMIDQRRKELGDA
jgi:BlaI family transcriptional regulator, penicillinase repressor